jgi:pimeloyl-ACP methyl ester carboxylesterase
LNDWSKYPEEIAGLVFVDPSYEDQGIIYSDEMPEWSKKIVKRISERYKNASKTVQSEFEEFKRFVNDKNKVLLQLPDIPIYILTNNKSDGTEITGKRLKIWRQMHESLFNQVSDAVHLVTTKSGHYIQLSEPWLVINAIKYIYNRITR